MSDTENNKLYPFQRNNYFYGKLMTVRDLEAEQDYINGKRHLLNRLLNGAGIVCGLGFQTGDAYADENVVKITFQTGGIAIDSRGREIVIPEDCEKEIFVYENQEKINLTTTHTGSAPYYLFLEYSPLDHEMVSAAANPSSCEETCRTNRVIEDFNVVASTDPPAAVGFACPELSGAVNGDDAKEKIKIWLKDQINGSCDASENTGVFFLALAQDTGVVIDTGTTLQYLSLVPDNRGLSQLITCHMADLDNPHHVTAAQIEALSTSGGLVSGSVSIKTTDWGALSASATATHGVVGHLTPDPFTAPSYRSAGVAGVSGIEGKHGVYAKSPDGTHALYVQGTAFFTGAKTGYVVDIFKNGGTVALETGDIVKLKDSPITRFYGDDDKIPVPEITPADKDNDECIIGIVDRKAIPENRTDNPAGGDGPVDLSVIEPGEELYVVTLGTYARCKVDASRAPVKRGNLLTSSKNTGYAQKAVRPKIGRIIGKALEPLSKGTGTIAVFVNIQ